VKFLVAVVDVLIVVAVAWFLMLPRPGARVVTLPAGSVLMHHPEIVLDGVELRGASAGTVLRAADDFDGAALLVIRGNGVKLRNITIDGNRDALERRTGLPPSDRPFSAFTRSNGVLAAGVSGLRIENVQFRNIAGFAVLVSRGRDISIDQISVTGSGSRNARGRNNSTGGVLLEEGTSNFRVTRSTFTGIRGNGLWTHSLFTSPRNEDGVFSFNHFSDLARDAIQVGHATRIQVEGNEGTRIGYPAAEVDIESQAYPVAIDTAGDVDHTSYLRNHFTEIDGKCVDLDGFHDGDVTENTCINRPDARLYPYGNVGILFNDSNPNTRSNRVRVIGNVLDGTKYTGIFLFGTGHTVAHNRLLNLNLSHCNEGAAEFGCYYPKDEPDALRSGIYVGRGILWPEPSRGNVIEDNEISGYQMQTRCIGYAPGVQASANTIANNRCK
jgi:Right handed beta helix region